MSDRTYLFQLPTGARPQNQEEQAVEMYMDGESGTWRLFLLPGLECVDFSLAGLREFHEALGKVLQGIETNPEEFNAEVRSRWALETE